MKGYKFFLEYPNNKDKRNGTRKSLGNHLGTIVAVIDDTARATGNGIEQDAISAVQDIPNSGTNYGGVSWDYLAERCKRISEAQAREIHPVLFQRLDDNS
jgi:hypothetical protein